MPEGPEVRRFVDALDRALGGKRIVSLLARTKTAKAWEKEHPGVLLNKRVERVRSRGKHLVGLIEGGECEDDCTRSRSQCLDTWEPRTSHCCCTR